MYQYIIFQFCIIVQSCIELRSQAHKLCVTVTVDQISGFDADCPGDTMNFLCSVKYNVFLTWRIVLPNNVSLNITYSNIEDISGNVLLHMDPDITSFVTELMPGQLIESTIVLTIPYGAGLNGAILECITSENSASVIISSSALTGMYNIQTVKKGLC